LNSLKKYVQNPVGRLYNSLVGNLNSSNDHDLIEGQPERHEKALNEAKKKEQLEVVFFVLNPDIWKYENVYRLLEEDSRFNPIVVICPATNLQDEKIVIGLMKQAYMSFTEKWYNVLSCYDEDTGEYLNVKEGLNPDLVFFTNPYGYTLGKYQIKNFLDTLTCYVQYSFIMEEVEHFYNKTFHSLLWKAFYETDLHKGLAKKYSKNKGFNVEVTGYPGTDSFIYGKREENGAWKKADSNLKRIIWAPHWSVIPRGSGRPSASNFLEKSDFMLELADQYKNEIQIAFKPHPYLKRTLYNLEGWGKEKTETYYNKWDELKNGQLETGNYSELFNGSDAMIHDSISFIAEYLYCGKPSLFLKSDPEVNRRFNDFGNLALDHHYHGSDKEDIVQFIETTVLNGADSLKSRRDDFYNHVLIQQDGKKASQNIYEVLCEEIFEG
jgi:hypothetical protein